MVSTVGEGYQDYKEAGEFRLGHPKGCSIEHEVEGPVKGKEHQKV